MLLKVGSGMLLLKLLHMQWSPLVTVLVSVYLSSGEWGICVLPSRIEFPQLFFSFSA